MAFPQWWRQGKLVDNFKDIIRKVVKKLSHMCQGNGGIAFRCRHDFRGRVQRFNWYKQQRCQGGWRSQSRKSNKSNTQKMQNPDEQAQPRKRTKLNRKLNPNGYRRHVIVFFFLNAAFLCFIVLFIMSWWLMLHWPGLSCGRDLNAKRKNYHCADKNI